MANYNLVLDEATFKPFSFEEMVKPYLMYGDAYKEIEDNLAALETEAGQWDNLANAQTDPVAHTQYKKYADDLRKQADRLSKYGMTPTARADMLKMRSRYSKEIVPIATAYERRKQLRDLQRTLNPDGSMRFSTDFSTISLDEMLANPDLDFTAVSGKEVAAKAAADFEALSRALVHDPEAEKAMYGYWQVKQKYGYDPDILQKKFEELPPEVQQVFNTIDAMYGDNPAYEKNWGHSWISSSMPALLGTSQYSLEKNIMEPSWAEKEHAAVARGQLALAQDANRRANEEWELKKEDYQRQKDAATLTLPDGRTNPSALSSLIERGLRFTGIGSVVPIGAAPAPWFGKGMGSGENNYATVPSGNDFDWGDSKFYDVDYSAGTKSHVGRELRKFVANHFGLDESTQAKIITQLAEDVHVLRDQDWLGFIPTGIPALTNDNEFAFIAPGISTSTGQPMEDNSAYIRWVDKANSLIAQQSTNNVPAQSGQQQSTNQSR